MLIDLFSLIPNKLKQQLMDTLVDVVATQAETAGGSVMARKVRQLRSDAAFVSGYETGLKKAIERFISEYELEDEDLVTAVIHNQDIFVNKEVQKALLAMVRQPGVELNTEQDILAQSFESVMPQRKNRERVNKAITFLLRCLAEEIWHLPELQPIYTLQFTRMTAEATREQLALQKAQLAALTNLSDGVREALLQLTDSIASQKLLPPGNIEPQLPKPKVYHNLPYPDYGEFIGREEELLQIFRLLRPHPQSRHHLIVIDGIGGIGKSTLALEVAHRCLHKSTKAASYEEESKTSYLGLLRDVLIERFSEDELRTLCFDMALDFDMLPGQGKGGKARELVSYCIRRNRLDDLLITLQESRPDLRLTHLLREKEPTAEAERFDAIIWTSAKQAILSADGIRYRRQVLRNLDDIYTSIALVLDRPEITRTQGIQQDLLVSNALARQRTLLIIDNLETVDDIEVITFLHDLPSPTKVMVTTRYRIDAAYPIRLHGLNLTNGIELISQECRRKKVILKDNEVSDLYRHTGGLPLAIVWSIAQMSLKGYSASSILNKLANSQGDIARFCFKEAMERIHSTVAFDLFRALSFFSTGATRESLAYVTALTVDEQERGLETLELLSLISNEGNWFTMLPITKNFAAREPFIPEKENDFRKRWVQFLLDFVSEQKTNGYEEIDLIKRESHNVLSCIDWCWQMGLLNEVMRLTYAIDGYLWRVGPWNILMRYYTIALEAATLLDQSFEKANFLRLIGNMQDFQGELEEAEANLLTAVNLYQQHNEEGGLIYCFFRLGIIYRKKEDYVTARSYAEKGLLIANRIQKPSHIIRVNTLIGMLDVVEHKYEDAEFHLKLAIDQYREADQTATIRKQNLWMLAVIYQWLGYLFLLKREYDQSESVLLQGLDIAKKANSKQNIADIHLKLAETHYVQGKTDLALREAEQAMAAHAELGMEDSLKRAQTLYQTIKRSKPQR